MNDGDLSKTTRLVVQHVFCSSDSFSFYFVDSFKAFKCYKLT